MMTSLSLQRASKTKPADSSDEDETDYDEPSEEEEEEEESDVSGTPVWQVSLFIDEDAKICRGPWASPIYERLQLWLLLAKLLKAEKWIHKSYSSKMFL